MVTVKSRAPKGAAARRKAVARRSSLWAMVSWWVFRGVFRQARVDSRSGWGRVKRSTRWWVQRKVPRPVRRVAYGVGVTSRATYRGLRHTDRTVAAGVRNGAREGRVRHGEQQSLRELNREFPGRKRHPNFPDERQRVRDARRARLDALRSASPVGTPRPAVTVPPAASPAGTVGPDPVVSSPSPAPTVPRGVQYGRNGVPLYPVSEGGGEFQVSGGGTTHTGLNGGDAAQMAAWLQWRHGWPVPPKITRSTSSGERPPSVGDPDRLARDADARGAGGFPAPSGNGAPAGRHHRNTTNGTGDHPMAVRTQAVPTPNPGVASAGGADISTVPGLERAYSAVGSRLSATYDRLSQIQQELEAIEVEAERMASDLEAAAAALAAKEVAADIPGNANSVAASLRAIANQAGDKARDVGAMGSAVDSADAAAGAALKDLDQDRALVEAVNSHRGAGTDVKTWQVS